MPRIRSGLLPGVCGIVVALVSQRALTQDLEVATPVRPGVDEVITLKARDGTPLEAKLTLPAKREGKVPVVLYLHGAGARTYDNPFGYVDSDGKVQIGRYLDFFADELAKRGVGFFRMSKRGCQALEVSPWMKLDRAVFSKATMSVMLDDYGVALDLLRAREEIDPARVVLLGASEGTRLAPQLAARKSDGVVGVLMFGYAADNAHDTIVWQMSVGPWRNVQHLVPAARGGELTRAEYDEALKSDGSLAQQLPFAPLDVDHNGSITPEDLAALIKPRLDMTLKAVDDRNDDLLWAQLMNLTSAYLLEWWDVEPNWTNLRKLDIPLHIFHGTLDGTCRVEGVHEAEQALRDAGRTNLTVHIYPSANHDLDWTWQSAQEGGPPAFREAFDLIAEMTSR